MFGRNASITTERTQVSPMKNTKLLTNRNGGPKTEAGRKRSSANALRHGVLSNKMIVLQTESEEEFEMLKRGYYEALKPANFLEAELVDEMIWAKWRQRRAITSETAAIDFQMDMEADRVDRKVENIDESTRTAHAIRTLSNESGELALYSRYETRLNRMYHRALERLLEMQDRRRAEAQAAEHGEGQVAENTTPAPGSRPGNKKLPNEPHSPPAAAEKLPPATAGNLSAEDAEPKFQPDGTEKRRH